ncbi:MAG: hypothetical protein LBQ89_07345 [Treponema sp.]|jgi:hypothetical protein|nr:hypothetical protein [Treponema sp.]
MAGTEPVNYIESLQQVLIARKDWLEGSELANLKENLRIFQASFASLYNIFLKKKLIDEDPYKHESKISELEVPESGVFNETKRIEQLSIRLSNFDNQLDFLVNFYQLGMDFLNLERVKRIVGLVRYIEWTSFTPDSPSLMTKAVSEMTNSSKAGTDTLTLSIIVESVSRMSKTTTSMMSTLKELNVYYRESYKLAVRQSVTQNMSAADATLENIRKKIHSAMPGTPFYKELIDEIIKEDYSQSGADLRDTILNSLRLKDEKAKTAKPAVNYKNILLDGIQVIGGASNSLNEIAVKLDENQAILENSKRGFLEAIKELIRQITHAEPEDVIYTVEYMDLTKGEKVKEKINYHQFRDEMDKKSKILTSFMRGSAYNKLSAMTEEQIIGYLEKNIRDVQFMHRSLNALDDFFKASVTEDREKIKGIKPELSTLKNSIVKANQLRYEYSAQKEEEDQFKRLGINPSQTPAPVPSPSPAPAPAQG